MTEVGLDADAFLVVKDSLDGDSFNIMRLKLTSAQHNTIVSDSKLRCHEKCTQLREE